MKGRRDPAEQFTRQAEHYARSERFRSGADLKVLLRMASGMRWRLLVDVGTGAGYGGLALATQSRRCVLIDVAPGMLAQARQNARECQARDVTLLLAVAEALPLTSASADALLCRLSAHHFRRLDLALSEMCRALGPGGLLLLSDTSAPEDPDVARWMNGVEARRDPTHVRDLSPSEWSLALRRAGFIVEEAEVVRIPLEFNDWVTRSATPAEEVVRLRGDFLSAPPAVKEAFEIRRRGEDILFSWPCLVLRARRG